MLNNKIKIQIGLTSPDPIWDILLHQIGIASKVVVPEDDLSAEYSIIIVNDDQKNEIDDYLQNGGVVLYTQKALTEIKRVTKEQKRITSLPPSKNTLIEYSDILDLESTVTIFTNNEFVHSESAGEGYKYFLGIDLDACFTENVKRKSFYTPSGRMPTEIVSKHSKGTIRQLIFSLLKGMHHRRSLPFIHQWYFPGSEKTIFTFRIDSDKGTQEQIEEIHALSTTYSIPTTWFLDVKSHESWLPYFYSFRDQEIGLHCYEHVLHKSAELNHDNFSKALTLLRKLGILPKGITAPTGEWHSGYAESIKRLGFLYSSEFSYDYDDLPSYPLLNGTLFSILQLPIHPVCIGTMLRARMDSRQMTEYYRRVIDTKLKLNEPVCLYHHPTHRHNEVFEEVFQYINSLSIVKLSYSEYAEWWRHRNEHRTAVVINHDTIEAVSDLGNIRHRIILPDGRETIVGLSEKRSLNSLTFELIDRYVPIPVDIMRTRTFTARHLLHNALDWWTKITE